MRKYAILLNEPAEAVSSKIEELYESPLHHKISDTAYLVRTSKLAKEIAISVGLRDSKLEDPPTGVVVRLNSAYSGYNDASLWEWFTLEEDDE